MSVVLAAIDDSAAARPVLDFAHELASVFGADLEVVYVESADARRTAVENVRALHLPLHRRTGEVVPAIVATVEERDAIALVLGTRSLPSGATPAGHVTVELVQRLEVPVAVVPPQAVPRPIRNVLVATEGDGESHALQHFARHIGHRRDPELIALHVFTSDTLPMFGDQPVHETAAWAEEFGKRVLRSNERPVELEVRVGDAPQTVRRVARERAADVVVLAWHRNLDPGHGRLVRSMLAESDLPVLLYPIG